MQVIPRGAQSRTLLISLSKNTMSSYAVGVVWGKGRKGEGGGEGEVVEEDHMPGDISLSRSLLSPVPCLLSYAVYFAAGNIVCDRGLTQWRAPQPARSQTTESITTPLPAAPPPRRTYPAFFLNPLEVHPLASLQSA